MVKKKLRQTLKVQRIYSMKFSKELSIQIPQTGMTRKESLSPNYNQDVKSTKQRDNTKSHRRKKHHLTYKGGNIRKTSD